MARDVFPHGFNIVGLCSVTSLEQLEYEERQGWYTIDAYQRFADKVIHIRKTLRNMIIALKKQGKTIAAYAAPAKGNTLLNYCGLGPDIIDYAAEKAPLKIGRYTPGMHIPVVDEDEAIRNNPPDYFFLLAWNFKDELIAKNQTFRQKGGKFIIPIPEPHII
jgi:hypothetical protein